MRILVLGGSFDPPHAGHLALARAGLKALRPGRLLVTPAYRSPFKEGHSAPGAARLKLAKALAKAAGGEVDAWEMKRGRAAFTVDLMRRLARKFPGAELWFLLGSDAAATLPRWREARALRGLCSFAVAARPGAPMPKPAGFRLKRLPGGFPSISSTSLRARLLAGEPCEDELVAGAAKVIRKRGLYGAALREELESSLKPTRWEHTLSVARLATELALAHGEDPEAAALAGLLHDAGRRYGLDELARYALRRRLPVPNLAATAKNSPLLLHAYVSADLARRKFGVRRPDVLRAISSHTLGRLGMSRLERLLYVADLAAEDRGFPAARRVRRRALRDLDGAFRDAVRVKLAFVRREGLWLHPLGPALARSAGAS